MVRTSALAFSLPWGPTIVHEVLRALNHIQAAGVIESCAIGGAIGATYYLEAFPTEDIDVFVVLSPPASGAELLLSLAPIYDALKAQGGIVEKEYVRFDAWPVQILTDANPLIAEAIREAVPVDFDGIPTRVFTAEHLCAIALQTGRPKDYLRVQMFLDQGQVDRVKLQALAQSHGLRERLRTMMALQSQARRNDP